MWLFGVGSCCNQAVAQRQTILLTIAHTSGLVQLREKISGQLRMVWKRRQTMVHSHSCPCTRYLMFGSKADAVRKRRFNKYDGSFDSQQRQWSLALEPPPPRPVSPPESLTTLVIQGLRDIGRMSQCSGVWCCPSSFIEVASCALGCTKRTQSSTLQGLRYVTMSRLAVVVHPG